MQDPSNQSNDSNVLNLMTAQKSVLTYLTSNLNIPKNQSVRNKHDRDNTLRQVGGIAPEFNMCVKLRLFSTSNITRHFDWY